MKKKLSLSFLLVAIFMAFVSLFIFTACDNKEIDSIDVTTNPTKMEYLVGELFDPTGMVVEVEYTDGSTKEIKDYTYSPEGPLEEGKRTITITWGEYKTNLRITLTDPITKVEKISDPTRLSYGLGEKFDPTGMQFKITYHSGKVDTADVSELTGVEYSYNTEAGLTTADGTIKVTYGGFDFDVKLDLDYRVYIEAEYGLLNGVEPNSSSTSNGGNYGLDSTKVDAEEGVLQLYEAQLKADFALTELKKNAEFDEEALKATTVTLDSGAVIDGLYNAIINWVADEANAEVIATYVESDQYKTAVEAYVESAEYAALVEQYTATNDIYLGGLGQGNVVTFAFSSNAEGKSNIAFRMSSAWLYIDNGNWNPIMMNDVQFNKLCEFYVNGVKYDIPDSVILEGGRTADGSTCQSLWVCWKEVMFENVDVIEGRNIIEIRVLRHGLVSPAQPSYSFSCNLDSLVVEPKDGLEINPFTGTTEATFKTTKVEVVQNGEKANLIVTGNVEGMKGYIGDLLFTSLFSGTTAQADSATVEVVGDKFTATFDITQADLATYSLLINEVPVTSQGVEVTAKTVTIGTMIYTLALNDQNQVTVTVDSTTKIVVNSVEFNATAVGLEVDEANGKVYVVISGGKADYTVVGYTAEEAKPLLEQAITALYYTDFQTNGGAWGQPLGNNFHTVKLAEDKTFQVLLDVTGAPAIIGSDQIMLHFVQRNADGSVGEGGALDFKPEHLETFAVSVTLGNSKYNLTYDKSNCFGLVYLTTEDMAADMFQYTSVALEERGGKAVIVLKGQYRGYTAEDMVNFVIDGEVSGRVKTTYTYTLNADGTFEIVVDLSVFTTYGSFYYLHAGFAETPADISAASTPIVEGKGTITVGNYTYTLGEQWGVRGVTITENTAA